MRMNATGIANVDDVGQADKAADKKPAAAAKKSRAKPKQAAAENDDLTPAESPWAAVVVAYNDYDQADGELMRLQEDLAQAEVHRDLALQRLAAAIQSAAENGFPSYKTPLPEVEDPPFDVPAASTASDWRGLAIGVTLKLPEGTCKALAANKLATLGNIADYVDMGGMLTDLAGVTSKKAEKVCNAWNAFGAANPHYQEIGMKPFHFDPPPSPPGTTGTSVPAGIAANDPSATRAPHAEPNVEAALAGSGLAAGEPIADPAGWDDL